MTTTTTPDRDLIVDALAQVWTATAELCRPLDETAWDTPTRLDGWTVRDNIAHLVGTESMLLGRPDPGVEVPDSPHLRNDIGRFNEVWVEAFRGRPGAEVLAAFEEVTAERLAALQRMGPERFAEEAWTPAGKATYGRFMQIRLFDCWMHDLDVRAALGVQGYVGGAASTVALAEVATALGYAVGKRAGAPDGSSVALVVTGADRHRFDVVVDGRAAVVDVPVLAPTATVTTDLVTFAALVGGRIDPEGPLADGRVTLAGDPDLARRVATHLAFVI